jgi:uncharacterized repeat protein (TIGR03803 family)
MQQGCVSGQDRARCCAHHFGGTDGANPTSFLTFDGSGNLLGTTFFEGLYNYGVVFRITL